MSKQQPNKENQPNKQLFPNAGQFVFFVAAIVCARSIEKRDKPSKGFSSHKTQVAKVEDGYLVPDKDWHIKKHT